jgi:hypothetical protein
LTEKGWDALREWLAEPAEYTVGRIEILLKLFFGRQAAVSTNIEHVWQFRALQAALLHKYAEIEKHINQVCLDDTERLYSLITLNYGRRESEALIDWCDETLAILNTMAEKKQSVSSKQEGDTRHG